MKRAYLEEDVRLIQKYFPGAKAVALRTPFDITARQGNQPKLVADTFRDDKPDEGRWYGDLLWSR